MYRDIKILLMCEYLLIVNVNKCKILCIMLFHLVANYM